MENFILECRTEIYFGGCHIDCVAKKGKDYGEKVLLVFGNKSAKVNGVYQKVIDILTMNAFKVYELWGVKTNPTIETVYEGIEIVKTNGINWLLGVGGGSVIDTVKAVAAGAKYSGDVWDFFSNKRKPSEALPYGCIATAIGSGSEISRGCVITREKVKKSLSNNFFRPNFAIINTEAMCFLEVDQIILGCMDIIAHVVERFFSNTPNVQYTDDLCLVTVRNVMRCMKQLKLEGVQRATIDELAYMSIVAQIGILSSGRITDGACHKLEHVLSGVYNISHTRGIAIVLLHWLRLVGEKREDKANVFFQTILGKNLCIKEQIHYWEQFYDSMGIPKHISINEDRQGAAIELKNRVLEENNGKVGNFMELNEDDILDIYTSCMEED